MAHSCSHLSCRACCICTAQSAHARFVLGSCVLVPAVLPRLPAQRDGQWKALVSWEEQRRSIVAHGQCRGWQQDRCIRTPVLRLQSHGSFNSSSVLVSKCCIWRRICPDQLLQKIKPPVHFCFYGDVAAASRTYALTPTHSQLDSCLAVPCQLFSTDPHAGLPPRPPAETYGFRSGLCSNQAAHPLRADLPLTTISRQVPLSCLSASVSV